MLKQHKNALLDVIKKSNIDPTLFRGIDSTSKLSLMQQAVAQIADRDEGADVGRFTVELRDTPLRFSVTHQTHDFDRLQFTYTVFIPGFPEITLRKAQEISELVRAFKDWLDVWVTRYIEEDQLPGSLGTVGNL